MRIRKSTEQDFERLMAIFSYARKYMAQQGNPNQWGPKNWPPGSLIRSDIQNGNSYVCLNDGGSVIGTFFFAFGKDIEPTYKKIYDGAWIDESAYGVIHRIAGDGSEKGIGAFCINWAFEQCGHIRIDTHGDNIVMQMLLKKLGFTHCGTIYIKEDEYPRLAYEKTNTVEKAGKPAGDPMNVKTSDQRSWARTRDDLVNAIEKLGFRAELGNAIAGHLGSPKAMERMIAYLDYVKPKSEELIVDEMLAIRSEIDAWREKKASEEANARYNEMLYYGLTEDDE